MTIINFDTEKLHGGTIMYSREGENLAKFDLMGAVLKAIRSNIDHLIPSAYQDGRLLIVRGYRGYPFVSTNEEKETIGHGYVSWYYIPLETQCDDALDLVTFWEKRRGAILFTNIALFSGRPKTNALPKS